MLKKCIVILGVLGLVLFSSQAWAEDAVPVCDIKVTPEKVNPSEPVTVDMSGTQNAQSIEVEVYDSNGIKVASKTVTPDSPVWQAAFVQPGLYRFKAKAIGSDGTESENPCQAKVLVNTPPECKIWTTCLPCNECVGRPIFFEAAFSSDPDGQIVKADFVIKDLKRGDVIDSFSDVEAPFSWEKMFDKPGMYVIEGIVTDDFGAESEPCSIAFEIIQKTFFLLVETGPQFAQQADGIFIIGRLGFLYEILPDFLEAVFSFGAGIALKDEPNQNYFTLNGLLNLHPKRFFFGAGLGYSRSSFLLGDPSVELVGNVGYDIFEKCMSKLDVYFELRTPLKEDTPFSDNFKWMLGLRFLF